MLSHGGMPCRIPSKSVLVLRREKSVDTGSDAAGDACQDKPGDQNKPGSQTALKPKLPEAETSTEKSEQGAPPPAPGAAPVAAQSYMAAARALKEQDPNYNSLSAAALIFRRAAAAFQAAGDTARAQAATDEAQTLESFIKLANERGGDQENQNRCGVLRGNALQCYDRATRSRSASPSVRSPEAGAFLDCVKTYCSAMQSARCPMPIFGKDNAGFCFTSATDDLDRHPQDSPPCAPGKHLVPAPGAAKPICQDDATGSTKQQPGPRGTKADR